MHFFGGKSAVAHVGDEVLDELLVVGDKGV
jgi:hypothetical protein